ncbi:MAG: TonB-dependent receptor [Xanthobacteraceae bacterium]
MSPSLVSLFRSSPSGLAGLTLGLILSEVCTGAASAREIPHIVVSATGIPTPADRVANTVTVITAEDIQRSQYQTVPDALAAVPGLNVVQTGGPGGLTSIFTRGTNSNHTKVLIDGIDVSDPSNPSRVFNFGHLLTADIERIEVLRGPQSGLYGADAIGGVISIVTKKGSGPAKLAAAVEGGSFETFNQNARVSGSQGDFNYAFTAAHLRVASTPVTPEELLQPGQRVINDDYDNWTYSTKLGADLTDDVTVNLVGRYTDTKLLFTADNFNVFPTVVADEQSDSRTHQFFTRGEAIWKLFDGRLENRFGVAYSDLWSWTFDPNTAPTVNESKGIRNKYDWRGYVTLLPDQILLLGLEQEIERLRTDTDHAKNENKGAFAEFQSEIARRFFLVANIRQDDNERFGRYSTWRVAPAVRLPVTETKLKASYGTGFKAATLSQLFVDFPSFGFTANRNLKPETSTGYDFGFEQPLFYDRVVFGVTWYHNDIKDLITFNSTFTSNENVGRATTEGYEAFAAVTVTERLKLRGDYTRTSAINEVTGARLTRRPKHKASASAIWNPVDPLTLSATVLYVGSWLDVDRFGTALSPFPADQYTLVNLAGSYDVNPNVSLFGRIDNLFDYGYQNPVGFERPGFGAYGGIRGTM